MEGLDDLAGMTERTGTPWKLSAPWKTAVVLSLALHGIAAASLLSKAPALVLEAGGDAGNVLGSIDLVAGAEVVACSVVAGADVDSVDDEELPLDPPHALTATATASKLPNAASFWMLSDGRFIRKGDTRRWLPSASCPAGRSRR